MSPLASAFLFAVALLLAAAGGFLRSRLGAVLAAVTFVGLLFTISRSAVLALAGGLVVLAAIQRARVAGGGRRGRRRGRAPLHRDLPGARARDALPPGGAGEQARIAREQGDVEGGATLAERAVDPEPPREPARGLETVAEHPLGYGLGNAGAVARREDVDLKAGESNYTEIGVETGVLGLAVFLAWNVALFLVLARAGRVEWAAAGVAASLATVLALARPDRRVRRPVARLRRLGPRRRARRHRRRTCPAGLAGARRPDSPATVRATDGEVPSGEI